MNNLSNLEKMKKYHWDHREEILKRQHKRLEEHREENKIKCKEYYLKNREERKKKMREYYRKNHDKMLEQNRKYQQEHYDEIIEWNKEWQKTEAGKLADAKKYAKVRGLGFNRLCDNIFDEPIAWHHLNDDDVIPFPRDIHVLFSRNDTKEHQDILIPIIEQLFPEQIYPAIHEKIREVN